MTAQAPHGMAAEARSVRIESETARRGIKLSTGTVERYGPCPACGGTDRFSINLKKQLWNCRGCARGGDVIALVRHIDGGSFREAVRLLTGHAPPSIPAAGGPGVSAGYMDCAEAKKDMPKIAAALPPYVECATIFAHRDESGMRFAKEAARLIAAKRVEVHIKGRG
jgi:hypothetical protein